MGGLLPLPCSVFLFKRHDPFFGLVSFSHEKSL